MITGDPMINKKKNTKKDDTSNSTVIKVMLLGFLGGNMIYAVIAFLMGDMQYIPEVLTKTGACLVIHTILLLGVTALEHIEDRNWRIKNRVGTDLGSEYKTLKCSATCKRISFFPFDKNIDQQNDVMWFDYHT